MVAVGSINSSSSRWLEIEPDAVTYTNDGVERCVCVCSSLPGLLQIVSPLR